MIFKESKLISVIIPVYNVEEYLDECIESVLQQTYNNLQIILVDDGSTDNCPSMCDLWAKKDKRIEVIHKVNGGLSSARNAGLEIAVGDYIGFVDSDDYIAPNMYEELLNAFYRGGSKIGITSGMVVAFDGTRFYPFQPKWNITEDRLVESNDFFRKIIDCDICITVWSKLYTASLINEVRFKEGRNNEDTLFHFEVSKIMEKMKISMLDIPFNVYYYRMRQGSICRDVRKPLQVDILKNLKDMMAYFYSQNDNRLELVTRHFHVNIVYFYKKILVNSVWKELYYDDYNKEIHNITICQAFLSFKNNLKLFFEFLTLKYIPSLYIFYFKIFY